MNRRSTLLLFAAILLITQTNDSMCRWSGPDSGSYFSGSYKNLFAELLGKNATSVQTRIDSVFHQIFYGDNETERLYYPVEPDMAYIEDVNNSDVRTEGISYGMMICVQLGKKAEFDRLWKWAKTHMQFQSGAHKGYFAWHCKTDGTILDATAASDGEEWIVTSLFFASGRWGDGEGLQNYRGEAQRILHTMLHKESESDRGPVTNMFNKEKHLVSFVPEVQASGFTDPSYQLPHYYELWARWGKQDNEFWCNAASASRMLLRRAADSSTGLSPDYCQFDGIPMSPWPGGHDDFRFDAWRVAMNVALDYQWFARDPWQVTTLNRLLGFFASQGRYGNQYTLNGKKLSDDHSPGLVAMNAVAALASTSELRKQFVKEFWETPVPKGRYRYYDGMLYMLGMLQVSGNFRVYHLTNGPVRACSDN
ncbi:MAG: glycosyl hydrolase family 8 [Bacteroidota bacterium]